MKQATYYSTNHRCGERVSFETALLRGLAPDYGLYMIAKDEIPRLSPAEIEGMKGQSYADISMKVLHPFLGAEIRGDKLEALLDDAYRESVIPTEVKNAIGLTYIMWLTKGPTYSFKDYAARFFGRALNYFLGKRKERRLVVVATSGDTGGAVADALYGLENVDMVVFYPKGSISEGQKRQMTTLKANIHAFEVNGGFDVCQALAKYLLGNKDFAESVFNDRNRLTSANSISVGRLLPQAVYPFFAYSRMEMEKGQGMVASIPSGNFGDMMGTVVAMQMGLPVRNIVCGVNENMTFPHFLRSGNYVVGEAKDSPSSAMNVAHPSNIARLFDFFGGHIHDERDPATKKVVRDGVITRMPDLDAMREIIWSIGVMDTEHFRTISEVFDATNGEVLLDPHGAVGWKALDVFLKENHKKWPSVIYETADPGKFPKKVEKAIGFRPKLPKGMKKQAILDERIYSINSGPDIGADKKQKLSREQIDEAEAKIRQIFS